MKGFLSVVRESINEWESEKFMEGRDSKVNLSLYRVLCETLVKKYLHGARDAGISLDQVYTHCLRSWVYIEEGRGESNAYCVMMNVRVFSRVLYGCPVYSTQINDFMCKLQVLLRDRFEDFESLDNFEKASFVLDSELGEDDFSSMLDLVKDYIVDVLELRKARLYDKNLSFPQAQCKNSSGKLGDVGDGGSLRCLHGKVDTTISCTCTCIVGFA